METDQLQERPEGTVFVVDDDVEMCRSVSLLARSVGLAAEVYTSADEFLERYKDDKPGCLILDVRMPGMSGLELQKWMDSHRTWPPIIFVTAYGELPLAVQAMRDGAVDFISKPFSPQSLLERIHEAIARDRDNRRRRCAANDVHERLGKLTNREREIVYLLADGLTTKKIAHRLSISPKTVDNHRAKILEKMGVDNPAQLSHLLALLN